MHYAEKKGLPTIPGYLRLGGGGGWDTELEEMELEKLKQREEAERGDEKPRSGFDVGQGGKGRFEEAAKSKLKHVPLDCSALGGSEIVHQQLLLINLAATLNKNNDPTQSPVIRLYCL